MILEPTYKSGWTIPGGQFDGEHESPWDACRRETLEECGLTVERGRLVCVDFRPPKPERIGGVRFLFDCGRLSADDVKRVRIDEGEISAYRFADMKTALELLSGPLRRRVARSAGRKRCIYLENGRPVEGVS